MIKLGTLSLAKRIGSLRNQQGLSQAKQAPLAEVSNNTIINLETGINNNPTIATLRKIAKGFGIAMEELI